MIRLIAAIPLGLAIALGLFFFMSTLVNKGQEFKKGDGDDTYIDFVRVAPQSQTRTRTRELPKKPPEPKVQPKMDKMEIAQDQTQVDTSMDVEVPDLGPLTAGGTGPAMGGMGGGGGMSDREVLPLVRIQPQYPRKAAMSGQEGWVKLKFDITEAGTVANVSVIESKPRRVFDRSARRALLKWKYKPKMVDGKPVVQKNLQVQLDFKLEN